MRPSRLIRLTCAAALAAGAALALAPAVPRAQGAAERDTAPASIDNVFRGSDRWPVIGDFAAYNELIRGEAWLDSNRNQVRFEIAGTRTTLRCIGAGRIVDAETDANSCQAVRGDMRLVCGIGREIVGTFDHNSCHYGFAAGMDTLTGSIISMQFDLPTDQFGMQSQWLASQAQMRPDLLEPQDYLEASGFTGEIYGFGTGFAITDDGVILTAAHVIEDEYGIEIRSGNRTAQAQVLAVDKAHDLALLKADLAFEPLSLMTADPDALQALPIKAIGYRIMPRTVPAQNAVLSTAEPVSTHRVYVFPGDIIPGYSGGPVITLPQHKVLGMIYGVTVQYRSLGWNDYDIEKVVIATDRRTIFEFLERSLDPATMAEIVAGSDAAPRARPFDASDSIVLITVY